MSDGSNYGYAWVRTPSAGDYDQLSVFKRTGEVDLYFNNGQVHREFDIRTVITIRIK